MAGSACDEWDSIVIRLLLVLALSVTAAAAVADEKVTVGRTEKPTHARADRTRHFGVEYMFPAK
ncbi:hypothetical protein, partial [Cupriavidus necator]|uniref:hypothetical protein n=1 Tax=Cupriavidus necator TaxID=106590 RepID=UPI001C40A274